MPKPLAESSRLSEAATSGGTGKSGRMLLQFITPGWGSSGYYSQDVLKEAAENKVIPAGTHLYLNHMTETERHERPERSVLDLAAVTVEDAHLNTKGGLIGEVKVFPTWREFLGEAKDDIGLSISGAATDITIGEAEGKTGPIIEGLAHVASVDFVTRAGRGGKVLQVLESARGAAFTESTSRLQLAEARNVGQWIESRLHFELTRIADDMFGDGRLSREERIALSSAVGDGLTAFTTTLEGEAPALYTRDLWAEPEQLLDESLHRRRVVEATADERRTQLSDAVRTAYAGNDRYAWVQDFDESTVWFQASAESERSRTWQQGYTIADDDMSVTLTGERIEVRPVTKYVPVNPAGQSTTQESEEDTMPNIEEARLRELEEAHGRVPTLTTERDTAITERDEARRQLAERDRVDAARRVITEAATAANVTFTPLEERGLLADLPTGEDGTLDAAAFRTSVDEAATSVRESRGEGQVRGFGGGNTHQPNDLGEADVDQAVAGAFGRTVKEA